MEKRTKRWIVWGVVLCVVIGLAVLCAVRWEVWFGQPEEEAYGVSDVPHRVMLTFGNDGELSRNVSWQCDSVVRAARVEYAEVSGEGAVGDSLAQDSIEVRIVEAVGEVFRSRAGVACYYYASLKDLQRGKRYRYRVVTDEKPSEWYEFKMGEGGDFGFVYVGDVQDTVGGMFNKFACDAFARHSDAEFLVCGGDLTERPMDAAWAETFRGLDSLRTAMPILAITGNHDYLKEVPRRLEKRFPLVFSYFLGSMVEENMVYSMRYGNAEFFLLDSNREFPYLMTQRGWLEEALSKSDAKWKIVVMHHPLYSLRGKNNLFQRWMFADLIEESGVDLVLQGHEHNYGRLHAGKTVYTISHNSPKTYTHKDLSRFEVTCIGSRSYQYVRVSGDTLIMSAHEVVSDSLIDEVVMVKE